jgi:hypothetical protein
MDSAGREQEQEQEELDAGKPAVDAQPSCAAVKRAVCSGQR